MAQKKKLQIFVSSTYIDLREERQAAVEAILTAGHIPAGMELFAAGDQSQMSVIKRWIDESDVYLLILGGRFGSIEPRSQKSYIQLEYEYAVDKGKPLFAVVIDKDYLEEKVKKFGTEVFETDNPQKLRAFREQVLTNMVRFWRNPLDIKLSILETMAVLSTRDELIGWVPGSEAVNAGALAEEIARLAKENAGLREQVKSLSAAAGTYNGLTFEEMYRLLATTYIDISEIADDEEINNLKTVASIFGESEPGFLHIFWVMSEAFKHSAAIDEDEEQNVMIASKLEDFGLIEIDEKAKKVSGFRDYKLTESGRRFLLRLRLERNVEKAEKFFMKPRSRR